MFHFCCGRATVFRSCSSHVSHCIGLWFRFIHPSLQQTEAPPSLWCQLRWGHSRVHVTEFRFPTSCSSLRCVDGDPITSPHVASNCIDWCCCQLRWVSFSRCSTPACCPACVDMLTFAGGQRVSQFRNVGYPSCSSSAWSFLPSVSRCHVTSPDMHMSLRVPVVSAQEHNAFISLLDDDTCMVRARIFFSSQTASGTRSHRRSDAQTLLSPTVGGLQVANASPTPTTEVSCRSRPLDFFIEYRPTLGSPGRPSSSHVENNLAPSLMGQKTSATPDVSQLSSPSRIISPCADWTGWLSARSCKIDTPASSAVLRVPRCGHFAAPRGCAIAAALLTHDHAPSCRHFTFPSRGFFKTFGSNGVVMHCACNSFLHLLL